MGNRKVILIIGLTILVLSFLGLGLYQMHAQKEAALHQLQILKEKEEARVRAEEGKRRAEEERKRAEEARQGAERAERDRLRALKEYAAQEAIRQEEERRREAVEQEKARQLRTLTFDLEYPFDKYGERPVAYVQFGDEVRVKVERIGGAKGTICVGINFPDDYNHNVAVRDGKSNEPLKLILTTSISDNDHFVVTQGMMNVSAVMAPLLEFNSGGPILFIGTGKDLNSQGHFKLYIEIYQNNKKGIKPRRTL